MPSLSMLLTILAALLLPGYLVLLGILAWHDRARPAIGTRRWLAAALLAALVGSGLLLLHDRAPTQITLTNTTDAQISPAALIVLAATVLLALFAVQTLHFLQRPRPHTWTALISGWWIAQAAAVILVASPVGEPGWWHTAASTPDLPGLLVIGGWIALVALILAAGGIAFYRAPLPEVANRAFFWTLVGAVVIAGTAMLGSGSRGWIAVGALVQFIGLAGALYAGIAHRVADLRRALRYLFVNGLFTTLTALSIFAALLLARQLDSSTASDLRYLLLAGLAFAIALLAIPLRALALRLVNWLFIAPPADISHSLQQFSARIAGIVELDTLAAATLATLEQVLRARRAGLILVTPGPGGSLDLDLFTPGLGEFPVTQGALAVTSPIHAHLRREPAPLLQYDLNFAPEFHDTPPAERAFFEQLRLAAYAPIRVEGQLIGLLGVGAKVSDDHFTPQDLDLLLTIAHQVGIALRNARLVADLRRRENEQAALNRALSDAKQQLERLDSVKTDFVTIASHELRTPLAQIRGYTDILDMFNDDGSLDSDQIAGMTYSLRRAANRLEELITAMLDVSELDVDAMNLHFADANLETVIRTAIEPLAESINQRKLHLTARGLRALPTIQGDQQRLTQAFRNLVVNAIKYTPDGGRIEIEGSLVDGGVCIVVHDFGVGIDPANQSLIFEKFFRGQDINLHSTGATKFMGAGPGLGLTIARGIITGHGGQLTVSSPGFDPENLPGSTFTVTLPLTPPESARRVMAIRLQEELAAVLGSTPGQSPPAPVKASSAPPTSPTLPHRPRTLIPPPGSPPPRDPA